MTEISPTGRSNPRLRQTAGDMVRSLALVLGVVAVILIVTLRPHPDAVKVIDYQPELAVARAQAGYLVLAPVGLDADWRSTSVRWQPTTGSTPDKAWHLGFVTPDDAYAQLGQSSTTNVDYLPEQTDRGQPTGSVVVGGFDWQQYTSKAGQRSLVRVDRGVTIVVTGTADWAALELFTSSLRS